MGGGKRGLFSWELFNILLNQLGEMKFIPRVVVLYHGGEPLLNKNLCTFVRVLMDYGVKKTAIVTNTSLLAKETIKDLLDSGLTDLTASYDGTSAKENDYIRTGANFINDSQNLLNLLKLKKAQGSPLNITISNVQVYTKNEVKRLGNGYSDYSLQNMPSYIKERFKEFEDDLEYTSFPAMVWPGYDIISSPYKIFVNECSDLSKICSLAFETITVLANGNVVPCCYDLRGDCVFGNILNNSIIDIWNNSKYTRFRDNLKKGFYKDNGICAECIIYSDKFLIKN
jgi:radical SAM protein with 4Fe4S-binding SPASM domain